MKPSARTIYKALKRGEVLTPQKSLLNYGIHALSQRIGELKRDASVTELIISERVKGDVYHRYYIKQAT